MDYQLLFTVLKIGFISFLVNLPFGMLRSRFKYYSVPWFLSIHAPIPVAAILRRSAGLPWWYLFIFMIFGIAGQVLGKKIAMRFFPPKK